MSIYSLRRFGHVGVYTGHVYTSIIINLSPYGDELYIKILQQIHNSLLKCVDFSVMNDSL